MKRLLGIAILTTVMACSQNDKKETNQKDSSTVEQASKNEVTLKDEKYSTIFNSYIILKNALVRSDSVASKKAALDLQNSLTGFKGCESTAVQAKKIAEESKLSQQRKDFTSLSADLIALFKHADLTAGTIYVQHCPMANKGDGGDWLSTEKDVKNPYYGDEMLTCGRVVEEIAKK